MATSPSVPPTLGIAISSFRVATTAASSSSRASALVELPARYNTLTARSAALGLAA